MTSTYQGEMISRRYTYDETVMALKHMRHDFTTEPAKAICHALCDSQMRVIASISYSVSYDAGESMFYLRASDASGRAIVLHERNLADDGDCWCIPFAAELRGML